MGIEGHPKPALALDVDQTLTGGVMRSHLYVYNQELGLGMTPEEIDEIEIVPGLKKTFDIPQIIAYRAQSEEAERRFQEVRFGIRTSNAAHLAFTALPHSPERVHELVQDGFDRFRYYTVRPKEIMNTTRKWLDVRGFPSAQETTRCTSHKDKVFKMVRDWVIERGDSGVNIDTGERQVIIIDDSFHEIIQAAQELAARYPVIQRALSGLIIVGFTYTDDEISKVMQTAPDLQDVVRTLALSSWEDEDYTKFRKDLAQSIEAT